MKKAEIIKRFGKKVNTVKGLADFLAAQEDHIEDISIDRKRGIAAFILDHHWWSMGSGGIGMASVVGIFFKGKSQTQSFTYRDQYNPNKDRWELSFNKISSFKSSNSTNDGELSVEVTGKTGWKFVNFPNPAKKCQKCERKIAEVEIFKTFVCKNCQKEFEEKLEKLPGHCLNLYYSTTEMLFNRYMNGFDLDPIEEMTEIFKSISYIDQIQHFLKSLSEFAGLEWKNWVSYEVSYVNKKWDWHLRGELPSMIKSVYQKEGRDLIRLLQKRFDVCKLCRKKCDQECKDILREVIK